MLGGREDKEDKEGHMDGLGATNMEFYNIIISWLVSGGSGQGDDQVEVLDGIGQWSKCMCHKDHMSPHWVTR